MIAVQITKIIVGAVVALGCLAVIVLRRDLDLETTYLLAGVAAASVGTSIHGAYKTPPKA